MSSQAHLDAQGCLWMPLLPSPATLHLWAWPIVMTTDLTTMLGVRTVLILDVWN